MGGRLVVWQVYSFRFLGNESPWHKCCRFVGLNLKMSDAYVVRAAPGAFEPWHNDDRKLSVVAVSGEAEVAEQPTQKRAGPEDLPQ
jgi:hypothetical protein